MTFQFGAALAVFLAAGSTPGDSVATSPNHQQIVAPVIEVAALKTMMQSGTRYMIVDVRQPAEFTANHIPGAMTMPFDTVSSVYSKLPKDMPLVIYCADGVRSAKVVAYLIAHGYSHAVSLGGGYRAWTAMA